MSVNTATAGAASLINTIDNGSGSVAQVANPQVYINIKTGRIESNVNTADLNNGAVVSFEPNATVFVDIQSLVTEGEFPLSNKSVVSGSLSITAKQYVECRNKISSVEKSYYEAYAKSPQDESTMKTIEAKSMKVIVDSGIDCPVSGMNSWKLIRFAGLIESLGTDTIKNLQTFQPGAAPSLTAQNNIASARRDQAAQVAALRAQLESNPPANQTSTLSQSTNTVLTQAQGFFDAPVAKEVIKFGYGLRAGEMTRNGETGRGMMAVGDGAALRAMRTKKLVNKMIESLGTSDADAVVQNVLCFRKTTFGRCNGFLHKNQIINSMKYPKEFAAKFKSKLDAYVEHRLRNLPEAKKGAMVRAITKAYNTFVQKYINEARAGMFPINNQTSRQAPSA